MAAIRFPKPLTRLCKGPVHFRPPNHGSLCAPKPLRPSEEGRTHGRDGNRRGHGKGVAESVVVDVARLELHVRGQRLDGRDGVSDFVNDLRRALASVFSSLFPASHSQHSTAHRKEKGRTLHLSGISPKASGSRMLSVVCTMAEVMATPYTVPSERTR